MKHKEYDDLKEDVYDSLHTTKISEFIEQNFELIEGQTLFVAEIPQTLLELYNLEEFGARRGTISYDYEDQMNFVLKNPDLAALAIEKNEWLFKDSDFNPFYNFEQMEYVMYETALDLAIDKIGYEYYNDKIEINENFKKVLLNQFKDPDLREDLDINELNAIKNKDIEI